MFPPNWCFLSRSAWPEPDCIDSWGAKNGLLLVTRFCYLHGKLSVLYFVILKVEPNAHKIVEHRRKYERLRKEREEKRAERDRLRRRAEAQVIHTRRQTFMHYF
jgi:hypothetical protein